MERRTKKVGRKPKKPNKQYFEQLYYNDGISATELAKLYEVKEQTIYNWAFDFRNESENSDNENKVSDKQIFHCLNDSTKKERSKIS